MTSNGMKRVLAVVAAASLVAACGSEASEADDPAVAAEASGAADADDATGSDETADTEDTAGTEDTVADSEGVPATEAPVESQVETVAAEPATIVVTANILGDVVTNLVGDQAEVITIMPVGADPHDFQASAQEVNAMVSADALIVNGGAFEEGLVDVIDNATDEGVPTHEAIEGVSTLEFGESSHSEHSDEEHSDEDHSDEEHSDEEHSDEEHSHDHDGADPHFFTDPTRMVVAVEGIVDFLSSEVEGLDAEQLDAAAADYIASLVELDAEVEAALSVIPAESRVLVTNHEVFGYFAERYTFEVAGTVIPSGSTADGASAGELAELAELIQAEGVPAIFSDTTASQGLVETLAAEVGDISIVPLFTESLGEADSGGATYIDMVRTNALRIADALS